LCSEFFQDALDLATSATTIKTIQVPELCAIRFLRPPTKEQCRIAEILDTIDEAIQKTEVLISKLKAMKQGFLHDLLTRGLDEKGKLRDPKAHPEQFTDSPLGRMPKAWETVVLRDEVDIFHGYAFEGNYFSERPPGEVLLVPGNFHREGKLYFEKDNTKYFRGPIPKGTVLNNGDILIVMTDLSPRTLILGRVVQLDASFRVLHNQRIGKIVFKNAETWCNLFFIAIMNDEKFRHNIILNATGTTVRHTSPDRILSNMIVKPQLEEQKRLAIVVDGQDSRIRTEEQYRDKLKLQKKGLMHDLLTGRVRVKVGTPEEDAPS
jgi:type I restriction enzyme S subunit